MSSDSTTAFQEAELIKAAKIAEVAGVVAQSVPDHSAEAVHAFLEHYFRHVDVSEVANRTTSDLASLLLAHIDLGRDRQPGQRLLRICGGECDCSTSHSPRTTVVELVTDDRPFIVDTITMELTRQGWAIQEVFHPQFQVVRVDGRLSCVVSKQEASAAKAHGESWLCVEVLGPLGQDAQSLIPQLEKGLHRSLDDLDLVVTDWVPMLTKALALVDELMTAPSPTPPMQRRHNAELLQWLAEDHFTFVGYREYRIKNGRCEPVDGTGLGVLRAEATATSSFCARPIDDHPSQLIFTKDSRRASVHRASYLDYVGIRIFNDAGKVVGEHRFLGLLSASAYTDALETVPVLSSKAAAVKEIIGYDADSHGGKAVSAALVSYPRDELFQATTEELAPVIEAIAEMQERRKVRLFVRKGTYGRFLSCLVFLPRDRYTTAVRKRLEQALLMSLNGDSVEYQARVSESVLARLFFVVKMAEGKELGDIDIPILEKRLTSCIRHWDDDFMDEAVTLASEQRGIEFPDAYKEDFRPHQGIQDLLALNELSDERRFAFALYQPDDGEGPADLRLKVFSTARDITLSRVMPHLTLLGVDVVDERPYEIELRGEQPMIYDFGLQIPGGKAALDHWRLEDRARFADAFQASYEGRAESDPLNALVMEAGLTWQEVSWLRAIARYIQQAGVPFSKTTIAQALVTYPAIAAELVAMIYVKFDPATAQALEQRHHECAAISDRITGGLEAVESLDHDRVLRLFVHIIGAMTRTNAFGPDSLVLAFKLLPRELDFLPEPRPMFEIFVYSPWVEGVHLRYGKVARGGLRWSDRRDDFRTEILGLVKAQMVKNTVIVPVGAKGGFFCKQLPNPAKDRQGWLDEGVACYRRFITALLSVTDNIVDGVVVGPQGVVRYDDDDPYLVVAADKGTATFSDIANGISIEKGYWLGDAFASGGSVGYDHKGMGITARGAWEAVKRHFFEMGIDCQTQDFTCVGIGDMGGDVFGNGMLLSRHIKLVAAFNHLHIFLDPNPDASTSFVERQRLFDERLGWGGYNTELISAGGGVFERSAKSIPLNPEIRAVLGIVEGIEAMTPNELITAILKAPVDLLWNGGIGTYVKAESETHAQVGDKANDIVRVNGTELRAKCVGEGGNLGVTQLGRIEYARSGGRINTDFIDNSAGVDTSDHEVNIKILLANEIATGRLPMAERDELLPQMTSEVADLVLAHNIAQNRTLQNGNSRAAAMVGAHEDWMKELEKTGYLDRKVQFMPSSAEMNKRIAAKVGLTNPELCTLLAWTKIKLADDVLASTLPDDEYLLDRLENYFPSLLRDRYYRQMPQHRLHREIISTIVVNDFVNQQGISAFYRLSEETGSSVEDIFRAQMAARGVFRAAEHEAEILPDFDASLQTALRVELRLMVERGTRWMLQSLRRPLNVENIVDQFGPSVTQIKNQIDGVLTGRAAERYRVRLSEYLSQGVDPELAKVVAAAPYLTVALAITQIAQNAKRPLMTVAQTYFSLGEQLSLDVLVGKMQELPRMNRWETMSRSALRDDLVSVHAQLTMNALTSVPESDHGDKIVAQWCEGVPSLAKRAATLREICAGQTSLSRMSVGMRIVRSLFNSVS